MNKSLKSFIVLIGSLFLLTTFAQPIKPNTTKVLKDSVPKKVTHFKVSGSYINNVAYNGRTDSGYTPYFTPSIRYDNKYGFYILSSFSYLVNAASRIDLFSVVAGYNVDITDNLSANISANKDFYNGNSTSIQSDISGIISSSLAYDLDIVSVSLGGDVVFTSKKDYTLNTQLAHEFNWGEKANKWTITPTVTANASTLNFYERYTSRFIKKRAKKKNPTAVSISTNTTVDNRNVNKLTLLDFELSVPINYDTKRWGASFTPTLAIPQSPIATTTTTSVLQKNGVIKTKKESSTPASEINLKDLFYAEIEVHYNF